MDAKKTISVITAGVLSLAMCGTLVSANLFETPEVEAVSEMSAMELVDDMGLGWNLGNTFDSNNVTWGDYDTPNGIETGWGNPTTTKDMISTIHDYGFDSIRIPITWAQMMDSDYTINEDYLARIKEVVDWCYEENMYVIINTHHDDLEGNWLYNATTDLTTTQKNFETVWTQISNYFADYDNHLVFEGMNEPNFGTSKVVALNQTFVDTVRATGGNNADRLLLISAPNTDLETSLKDDFTVPDDDMIAVSIHYYLPSTFCVAEAGASWGYDSDWGTDTDKNELVNNFEKMKTKFMDNDIPVILGEYGVLTEEKNGKDHDSIVDFLTTVAETSKSYSGITSFLWDSSNAGDMNYFDRKELTFFDKEIGDMYIKVNGSDYKPIELDWVETEITTSEEGTIAVQIGTATKVKVEATATPYASGTGVIGYWDNNANDGKGKWVQNQVYIRFDTDENGNVVISQTADDTSTDEVNNYETVIHEGYFELPEGVSTDSVQVQFYYCAYWDNDAQEMVEVDNPVLTKAYIPGITSDSDTTTTETSDVTEPPVTTTETSNVNTTPAETDELAEPDFENLFGYVYPLFDNGVSKQWTIDGSGKNDTNPVLAQPVAITGNGDYTLTINIPDDGAAESILFFALSTDLNKYQQNANEEEIFSNMTFTINSIKIDGVEVEYGSSSNALGTNDDGSTYRMTIFDEWSDRNIQDINPNVINTSNVVVNFTIDGIVGSGDIIPDITTTSNNVTDQVTDDITTTSNNVTDQVTDDITTTSNNVTDQVTDDITTTSNNVTDQVTDDITSAATEDTSKDPDIVDPNILLGDSNDDGEVSPLDILLVKKYCLQIIDETGLNMTNSDVTRDGFVEVDDLVLIKKFVLTIIDSFD